MTSLASSGFRIPVALDAHGVLVSPEHARARAIYACPGCGERVALHAGEKKSRHFHHVSAACTNESVVHKSAKRLIVQAVEQWRAGGTQPAFVRRCASVGCSQTCVQPMPRKVRRAAEEFRLPSGYIVDVALLGPGDIPIAAIEIHVTHAVTAQKARDLPMPWIEVSGEQVCESLGRLMQPTRDKFLPRSCTLHDIVSDRKMARVAQAQMRELVRKLPFSPKDFPGYHVTRVSTCPRGHDTVELGWEGAVPPWPRPPSVVAQEAAEDTVFGVTERRMRNVLPFRRSWANACVRCGIVLESSPEEDRLKSR